MVFRQPSHNFQYVSLYFFFFLQSSPHEPHIHVHKAIVPGQSGNGNIVYCCGSILSLVQILFSFVFGYSNVCMVIYDNEFETKEKYNFELRIKLNHKIITGM